MSIYDLEVWNDQDAHWQAILDGTDSREHGIFRKAYETSSRVHAGQLRHSAGKKPIPYIVHPLRVARLIIEEWKQPDTPTIVASILHDVVEDRAGGDPVAQNTEIKRDFGLEILEALHTLTKPRESPMEVHAARDARYFRQLRAAPEWVRTVKCADRVDNLRDARVWGDREFWYRYSSETIGWHLFLARETAPIAEVAIFKALVEGERDIRGRVPVWADGHMVDPIAAAMIPEHVARNYGVVGLAIQGDHLYVGMRNAEDAATLHNVALVVHKPLIPVSVTQAALDDVLAAGMFRPGSAQ